MKEKKNDLLSGIVFLAFAAFVYYFSFSIKATTSDVLGSRFFPQAVAVLIGILSIVQIVGSAMALKAAKPAEQKEEKKEKGKPSLSLLLTTAALFAYFYVIQYIGFTATSILYLLFQCFLLMKKEDRKNKKTVIIVILVSILIPLALNFIFWNIFSIRLPVGKLLQ